MKYIKRFEDIKNEPEIGDKVLFKIGDYVISPLGRFKIVDITDYTLWVENEDGYQAEFLKKGLIPEIEYNRNKYNL